MEGYLQTPMAALRGHTGKISRAVFDRADATKAFSAGWDHTVRSWDLSIGAETSSKVRLASVPAGRSYDGPSADAGSH